MNGRALAACKDTSTLEQFSAARPSRGPSSTASYTLSFVSRITFEQRYTLSSTAIPLDLKTSHHVGSLLVLARHGRDQRNGYTP